MRLKAALTIGAITVVALAACSGDDSSDADEASDETVVDDTTVDASSEIDEPTPTQEEPPSEESSEADAGPIVFNGQGNDLVAYSATEPFESQVVIRNASDDPEGRDINGQICFDPSDPQRFVAGEDTDQEGAGSPGWGIFELEGTAIGELSATQVAKLVPTYQSADDNAENYGCAFLSDGRILTTDIGNQAEGEPNGQLIVWFPPFGFDANSYCKVDVTLSTGQGILVDDEYVYVAQARAPGVFRYPLGMLPTSTDAAGGCDGTDATGAPLATGAELELFIEPDETNRVTTPNAIVKGPDGTLFVSSVFDGVISEFDSSGSHVRVVLAPPEGETLGAEPFSTGTPLGLGVAADGTLFYADLGLVIDESSVGPGQGTGTVRRLDLDGQDAGVPQVMDEGLSFPDGIGIYEPDTATSG